MLTHLQYVMENKLHLSLIYDSSETDLGGIFGLFFKLKVSCNQPLRKPSSRCLQLFGSTLMIKVDNTLIDAVKERKGRAWQQQG